VPRLTDAFLTEVDASVHQAPPGPSASHSLSNVNSWSGLPFWSPLTA